MIILPRESKTQQAKPGTPKRHTDWKAERCLGGRYGITGYISSIVAAQHAKTKTQRQRNEERRGLPPELVLVPCTVVCSTGRHSMSIGNPCRPDEYNSSTSSIVLLVQQHTKNKYSTGGAKERRVLYEQHVSKQSLSQGATRQRLPSICSLPQADT